MGLGIWIKIRDRAVGLGLGIEIMNWDSGLKFGNGIWIDDLHW